MEFKTLLTSGLAVSALALAACDVEKTQEGEMPDVDVSVEGGQLPKYDVEGPDVDVGTKEVDVKVPDVDVRMEEKTVTVPDVDVTLPEDTREELEEARDEIEDEAADAAEEVEEAAEDLKEDLEDEDDY